MHRLQLHQNERFVNLTRLCIASPTAMPHKAPIAWFIDGTGVHSSTNAWHCSCSQRSTHALQISEAAAFFSSGDTACKIV